MRPPGVCHACGAPAPAPSVVARISLVMHDDGAMSIGGNIGDVNLALSMIDAAREAVKRQLGKPTLLEPHGAGIPVPHIDVDARPNESLYPLLAEGDRDREP